MPVLMDLVKDKSANQTYQTVLEDYTVNGVTYKYPFGYGAGYGSVYAFASIWYRNGSIFSETNYVNFSDVMWDETRMEYYEFPIFSSQTEAQKYAQGLEYDASTILRGEPYIPPKEYLWKVQSPNGKIYHIRDAEAKEILDNLETFEVDVDSHVLHINGDSAAGGGSTHTYSTTEQVVGTWIDGKPIYECTYELSNISCQSGTFTSTGISRSGIDSFIQGFLLDTGGSATSTVRQCFQCVGIGDVGDYIGVLCYFTNSPRQMQYLIVQYTKTTD